ncbi:MAG TPA: immunoglobulin domain-containing protein [Methylomirabilota bacterium]|nr:immunoglobulin domain-containing protein [Methylomirabilota bacterium]
MRPVRVFLLTLAAITLWTRPAPATGFGVNAHIPNDALADRIADAGIEWVRIDVLWALVEPEPDVYDWSVYDALVERLTARGLRIYAGLGATPAWATAGTELIGVPDDPDQWRELCYLAAARYAGRIDAWGLWNEPNQERFWEGSRREFIDVILIPGAEAIALADPGALVCGPDLAHLSNAHWEDWLREVIGAARDLLDVVAHHSYPSDGRASDVTRDLEEGDPYPFGDPSIREVLEEEDWWPRPFWLTETGVESGRWGEITQADFVRDLLQSWFGPDRGRRSWVDRVFFYEMADPPAPSPYSFGLLGGPPDLEPKLAHLAYADFIAGAEVDDAELVAAEIPVFFSPGETADGEVTLRNTGTTIWDTLGPIRLTATVASVGWQVEVVQLAGDETVAPGETHTFHVTITAPGPPGKRGGRHPFLSARMEREGAWAFGDMLRQEAILVWAPPPAVIRDPEPGRAAPGVSARLRIEAEGHPPLRYRWLRNGVELADGELWTGTDTPNLTVVAVDPKVEGIYRCEVSNDIGAVVSAPADLVIGTPAPRRVGSRLLPVDGGRPRPPQRAPDLRFSGPPEVD